MEVISPTEHREPAARHDQAVSNVTFDCYHTAATSFHADFVDVKEKCSTDFGLTDGIRTVEINTAMTRGEGEEEGQMSSKSARLGLKYVSFANSTRSSQSSSVSSPVEAQHRSQKESEDCEFSNQQEAVDVDIDIDTSDTNSNSSTPSG